MEILVVGLSHKTAPVEVREKLSFSESQLKQALQRIKNLTSIKEGMILSTCNRVEVFFTSGDKEKGVKEIKHFLADSHSLGLKNLEPYFYTYASEEAIKHIFRVASSLDSMIVGEPQILGQIKEAYSFAVEEKTSGLILNRLLHRAFSVAKQIRTETNIATSAVSVSFAAVELAKKIFGGLEDKKVALIGSGEMADLAAKHLLNNGVKEIMITNRTYERAVKAAQEFGGKPFLFEHLALFLPQVDIVLSSTAAPHYILKYEEVSKIIKLRKNKPMFFIDIAVPRDIDPRVNEIPNVYLYDIDDLEGMVQSNLKAREKEAFRAEEIIEKEKFQFYQWLQQLEVIPTIVSLKKKLEEIRKKEIEKTLSSWKEVSEKEEKKLEALTSAIVNKILHEPITYLKKEGEKANGSLFLDTLRKLFNLDKEQDP